MFQVYSQGVSKNTDKTYNNCQSAQEKSLDVTVTTTRTLQCNTMLV